MDQFAKETLTVSLEEEMRKSYLDYAMSVIVGRALPDVRDGLKPVHRRVLYSMHMLNNDWNRSYKKAARIVGDVIGKYHPHGDVSVYDTIVRMAQNFSLRYLLIDGQGNFGSIDGDSAAAMRYTEIRMTKIGHELLSDLDQETVNFLPNYDGSESEPLVLPACLPNLIINGSSGIAVGMATSIPPHNLNEVINACRYLLIYPQATTEDLIKFIPGPDLPTGGIIYGISDVHNGYKTGRGRAIMRAKFHYEKINNFNCEAIIIDELPYQVNKRSLLERIVELINNKTIDGITELRDESDKGGMRIVIELRQDAISEVVINNLFKQTQLQDTFSINMVALVDGQPKLLNLQEILNYFLSHRREIITRRTLFQLRKARERSHILEGLAVALTNIEDFIQTIRSASSPILAKQHLINCTWKADLVVNILAEMEDKVSGGRNAYKPENLTSIYGLNQDNLYCLSDIQIQEILQLRLQRLTSLEQNKIISEYHNVLLKIIDLLNILENPKRITNIIDIELERLKLEFGDVRRSKIEYNTHVFNDEDMIKSQEMVITISYSGYIKSQILSEYRAQRRGGRGKQATLIKNDDWIETLFVANTHDYILCFSNAGRVYWIKVYEVPYSLRNARGQPIVNMVPLQKNEKINVVLPVKTFTADCYIVMATSLGTIKKTSLAAFSRPLYKGIIAIALDKDDYLVAASITNGNYDIMLFSNAGKAVRFNENDVRSMGREARGVRGMQLSNGQILIAMLVAKDNKQSVLTATENGFGKRTPITEYTRHGRGTKGVIAIQTTERNGKVVAAILVHPDREIMLITTTGVLIRTRVSEIPEMGRATQGVTLINLDNGSYLSGLQQIPEADL